MKRLLQLCTLLTAFVSCQQALDYQITPQSLRKHIDFMAAEERQGRLAGTLESKQVADYIAQHFADANLQSLTEQHLESFDFKPRFKALYPDSTSTAYNVVGVLPGTDPALKEEYVIVGAHFDHLGHGGPSTSSRQKDTTAVHNGADDNASGVSALLELSHKLAQTGGLPRPVLFIAFGAEEQGLIGSRNFIAQHPELSSKASMMLNFDMIGRLRNERKMGIGGTGTAIEFDSILHACQDTTQVKTFFDPNGKGGSDHHNFYTKANIPVLFFHTGGHADYHKPSDDVEKVNFTGLQHIAQLAFRVVETVANQPNKLSFRQPEKQQEAEHETKHERKSQ